MKQPLQEEHRLTLQAAIASAEKHCSGEIRVHVAETCTRDALIEARYWFQKLGMHKTALRNGILFYIALDSRKYAILGDQGIHEKVGQAFWDDVRDAMRGPGNLDVVRRGSCMRLTGAAGGCGCRHRDQSEYRHPTPGPQYSNPLRHNPLRSPVFIRTFDVSGPETLSTPRN